MTVTLYRLNSGDGAKSKITNLDLEQYIEFSSSRQRAVPDVLAGLVSMAIDIGRHQAENPLPHSNEADKPDTGFARDTYTLNVLFMPTSQRPGSISIIRKWMVEPQTVDGEFDEGRFGLTNPFMPEYDLLPNTIAGYKIANFRCQYDLATPNYIPGTITLEFSGDPKRLGAARLTY